MLVASIPAYAEINTLEEALALAYQHDPGLDAQRAKLRATDEQVSQALSNYRPSIDATADTGRSKQDIVDQRLFPDHSTLTPRDAGVSVTQPVFRGFRTQGSVDSAKATVKAGRATLEDAEQQLMLDTAKAYLDVVQAQDLVEINRTNEKDLLQQLAITRDRLRIGELKKTDVNQAESRFKIAQVARLQAENELSNKRANFARLVGEMPGTLTPPTLTVDEATTLEDAVAIAQEENPNVVAASFTKEAARADVTVAQGSLLPEVSVVGSAAHNSGQNVTLPQRQDNYSLVAKVTVPLYRAGTDYSKTRAAEQTVTQRDLEYDDARNKAKESALTAWQTLVTARSSIDGDKEALDATDKALYGVKEEAKVGTRTTLDILNAQQELLNARTSLVKAVHDEAVAVLQVKAAIGRLTAQALNLPVNPYDPNDHYEKARDAWAGLSIKY